MTLQAMIKGCLICRNIYIYFKSRASALKLPLQYKMYNLKSSGAIFT